MEEIWKDIEGYVGKYQVSNYGRVISLKDRWGNYRRKELKPIKIGGKNNYLQVNLCKDGLLKKILIHRLVAEAFIPNPDNLPIINHKDENPQNNRYDNLEWCDKRYNILYGSALDKVKTALKGKTPWNKGKSLSYVDKLKKGHNMTVRHWKYVDGKRVWY